LFALVRRCPLGRKSKYSAEFQTQAVRLLLEPGATNESVGRDLGVSRETIRLWARKLAAEADPEVRRAREEHAELVSLRRRVRVLEEEREILAKAAAFRARETGRTR
jgi:transposase-like protein